MHPNLYKLLNIKPVEFKVVRQLFLVQLFLGIATAFLFTSTLTLLLHSFDVHYIPRVYLLTALLLLVANRVYSLLEHAYSARKLLQVIILFSAASLLVTWGGITFISYHWLPFFLSAWNLVVFMLVGYAFWGMAAIIFNVRESKRVFSLVGSGDLPAKLIGYALVPILIPYIGVNNLLWFSVVAFAVAYYFLNRFQHEAIDVGDKDESHHHKAQSDKANRSVISRIFQNELILYISLFSLVGFTIYALIDYTLLVEVKAKFTDSPNLAIFIGIFFAVGRLLAIFFKVILSSRMISNLGLANSLLISPVVLLLGTGVLFALSDSKDSVLYTFGIMVLCSEILKSIVQEPAFFVLFQPLKPHTRLKGHLIAKGYMMPFALAGSGIFLLLYDDVSILFIGRVLLVLLLLWLASVYFVKKAYLHTLVQAIQKGWFTGSELFLQDDAVTALLLDKVNSNNAKEIIVALELLERSGYKKMEALLQTQFSSDLPHVRRYALAAMVRLGVKETLPLIKHQLAGDPNDELRPALLEAYYLLKEEVSLKDVSDLLKLSHEYRRFAFTGLLLRQEAQTDKLVLKELEHLIYHSNKRNDKELALALLSVTASPVFYPLLEALIASSSAVIAKKAMETTGKVKAYELLGKVIKTATERELYYAFQKSLVQFGDEVFEKEELQPALLAPETLKIVVAAAGKVKGENSTEYLLNLLRTGELEADALVDALWLKQVQVHGEDKKLIEEWLRTVLFGCQRKSQAFRIICAEPRLHLLNEALASELKQNVERVLKGLALCYDKTHIDRVNKLLQLGDSTKISNAIEILEHSIPKGIFSEVDQVLDFVLSLTTEQNYALVKINTTIPAVITAIIKDREMRCSVWTKSIACFLIPTLESPALLQVLSDDLKLPKQRLFQETKDYVLNA